MVIICIVIISTFILNIFIIWKKNIPEFKTLLLSSNITCEGSNVSTISGLLPLVFRHLALFVVYPKFSAPQLPFLTIALQSEAPSLHSFSYVTNTSHLESTHTLKREVLRVRVNRHIK